MKKKYVTIFTIFFAVAPFLAILISLGIGRYHLSIGETIEAIIAVIRGAEVDATVYSVLFKVRLPRLILALFVGAGLAVAGTSFNPCSVTL